MKLPNVREPLPVKGVVRHCRQAREDGAVHFLGVSFESLEPASQSQLQRTVNFFLNKKTNPKNFS